MRAFLCSIDEAVWDAVEIGWTRSGEANIALFRGLLHNNVVRKLVAGPLMRWYQLSL